MPKSDFQPPAPEAVEQAEVQKPTITKIPASDMGRGARLDETVKGGIIVARVMGGTHYQVQNAEGDAIHGKVFDPIKKCVVDA